MFLVKDYGENTLLADDKMTQACCQFAQTSRLWKMEYVPLFRTFNLKAVLLLLRVYVSLISI